MVKVKFVLAGRRLRNVLEENMRLRLGDKTENRHDEPGKYSGLFAAQFRYSVAPPIKPRGYARAPRSDFTASGHETLIDLEAYPTVGGPPTCTRAPNPNRFEIPKAPWEEAEKLAT
jgi:hypothetical protein